METEQNKVPNLDAMTIDELTAFWMRYQNTGCRKDARELVGHRRKGYTIEAADLGAYAANKSTAMRCRETGAIEQALQYEKICDRIYKELPTRLHW